MADSRFLGGLAQLIRNLVGNTIVGPRVDWLALYPCTVVKQNSDGTLELVPDDTRVPPLSNVPIRYGSPGLLATVPAGSRCVVTFAGGDPQKKIVTAWEGTADTVVVRYSDLKALLDAQTHIGNLGYPTSPPQVVVPSSVGSSIVGVK